MADRAENLTDARFTLLETGGVRNLGENACAGLVRAVDLYLRWYSGTGQRRLRTVETRFVRAGSSADSRQEKIDSALSLPHVSRSNVARLCSGQV